MRLRIASLSNDGPEYVVMLDELTDEQHAILTETDQADWIRRVSRAAAVIVAKDCALVSVVEAPSALIEQDTADMVSAIVWAALTRQRAKRP